MPHHRDDVDEICRLKYRYLRTLDTKQWDDFETTLAPDCTGDYAGLAFADRAALVAYMRENLGAEVVTMHHVHHPEIEVDGDEATGTWALHDRVLAPAYRFWLEGAAVYRDRYRRTPEGWRITHTGYTRTYELAGDLADLPSVKLTAPGAPPIARD